MLNDKLKHKVREHLEKQYQGILNLKHIQEHINNHVEFSQSEFLMNKIKYHVPLGKNILDVGSGYGSFVLAARKEGYDCYGLEIEEFEHHISQERAMLSNVDPKIFICGSAHKVPFPDEHFEVITYWNVLEHVSAYKNVLKEGYRVLKPGGKIFIIAPNYFAFRSEAHYHVPWLPLFPKIFARGYLKLMGKNPSFLNSCIFYITMHGIKRYLKRTGFELTTDAAEKVRSGHKFNSSLTQRVINFIQFIRIEKIFIKFVNIIKQHPFVHSIDIIAKK